DYVFVPAAEQDRLVEGFRANVEKNLYDGGKLNKEAIAQVVNRANFDRVKGLFDDAVEKGATVAVGGTFDEEDLTVHPTMLTNVTPQMKDRKSTRLNSSHVKTSYAVFCLKK